VPLQPEQFDELGLTLRGSVLEFFKRNRFLAYSTDEIISGLVGVGVAVTNEELSSVLEQLVRSQRVARQEQGGEIYYRYDNRLGYRPPR
jgi:hypothetical protein